MAGERLLPNDIQWDDEEVPSDLQFDDAPPPNMPRIHGATKPPPEDLNDLPSTPPREKDGAISAGLRGFTQHLTGGYGDEIQAAIGTALPDFGSKSYGYPIGDDEDPDDLSFLDKVQRRYKNERTNARRGRDIAKKDQPAAYGLSGAAGATANALGAGVLTGGLAFTPPGAAVLGGLVGAGNSDAPLFSQETANTAEDAAMLSGLTAGFGNAFPIAASLLGGGAGAGLALFGDRLGMDEADRWMAGAGGAAGLLGGTAAAGNRAKTYVANKTGEAAQRARGEVKTKLEAKDAKLGAQMDAEDAVSRTANLKKFDKQAAELEAQQGVQPEAKKFVTDEHAAAFKQRRADERELDAAMTAAGKEKLGAFDDVINEAGSKRIKAGELHDDYTVDAMRKQEAKQITRAAEQAAAEGADPHARAVSALGHKAKEFYAGIRTQLGLGQKLSQEQQDALAVLHPDFEARLNSLAGEFKEGKGALLERLVAQFEAEAAGQVAPKWKPGTKPVTPQTEIGVPSPEMLESAMKPKPNPRAQLSYDEQIQLAKEAGVEFPPPPPTDEAWSKYKPEAQDREWDVANQFHAERDRDRRIAMERALDIIQRDPGETPDLKSLVSPNERSAIAKRLGKDYLARSTEDKVDLDAKQIIDEPAIDRSEPGTPPQGGDRFRFDSRPSIHKRDERIDDDLWLIDRFWKGIDTDYVPKNSREPTWAQLSSPDAPLTPGEGQWHGVEFPPPRTEGDYLPGHMPKNGRFERNPTQVKSEFMPRTADLRDLPPVPEDTAPLRVPGGGLGPTMDDRVQAEVAAAGPLVQQQAVRGAVRGARNPFAILGAGKIGILIGALNGAVGRINMLAEKNPAIRAHVLEGLRAKFATDPARAAQYGHFIQAATTAEGLAALVDEAKKDPEVMLEVLDVLSDAGAGGRGP